MNKREPSVATPLSFGERLTVFAWRRVLMPFITMIGGSSAPRGRVREQRYGTLPDEVLDVIAPTPGVAPRTPVIFIHGGGWIAGSKGSFYNRPLLKLADAGHQVFSLNYPLAPERPHPYMLRSLLGGLAWIARTHGVREVHLIGDSAGGNLATMLGLMIANPELLPRFDAIDPATLPAIRSITSLYGVMDRFTFIEDGFPSGRLFLKAYAGENVLDAAQRLAIPVTPTDMELVAIVPPTFLGAGTKDKLARSSGLYAEHLRAHGARVIYRTYEGADHGFFSFGGPEGDALRADVTQFLAEIETTQDVRSPQTMRR